MDTSDRKITGEVCKLSESLLELSKEEIAERAYLAGILDGEGYLGIMRRKSSRGHADAWVECITVGMTNGSAVEILHKKFGGSMRIDRTHPKWKPRYVWNTTHKNAENVVRALIPFLRVKKEQAELILSFRKLRRDQNLIGKRGITISSALPAREFLRMKSKELTYRGVKC